MERHEVLAMMTALKLAGMRAAYDDILADGLKRRHPVQQIIGTLLQVEIADKTARSIKYQMASARLPTAKELADFDFAASPVNEPLIQELAGGGFLEGKRNIVLVGGTGTGKTHLAVAIARSCIRKGARGRCYNVVDLVNHLEAELRAGRQGRTADQLVRRDFVILDELGYLPFAQAGGQLLFHLMSRLPDTRLTHVHRADPGLYQPFRQVAIAYNPATAPVINQRRMTFQKLGNFSFHGLSQQLTRPSS